MAPRTSQLLVNKADKIREAAEADLVTFIRLVHPQRVLGAIHEEVCRWWTRDEAKSHQLTLLPRDHMKSALAAYRVAWEITRDPTIRVLYISSTSNLATKQLKFIKDILLSPIYRRYWPEMVNEDESKREKWTETEIAVDHPKRKAEAVRDPTIFTAGLTTGITGMHCDVAVLDDVVVKENAYTKEGRDKVQQQYSLLSSIEGADGREWAVGTRYNPLDLYNDMAEMTVEVFDARGEIVSENNLYEIFERPVENSPARDGTGDFLWPRQQRSDGKWFGFDQNILAKKRGQYLDKIQFFAQYYNNPNDSASAAISRDYFQYYDPKNLIQDNGKWYFRDTPLNVFAAVDFAFSTRKRADYSAIAIVGVSPENNYYVLEISRFKTTKISEYFQEILRLYIKWNFRKIRCEVTSAQKIIVQDLKDNYIREFGLALSVEEFAPTRHIGTKEERMEAVLQPRYANLQVWHYKGGNCALLEEELVQQNPAHDDMKDALSSAIAACVPPSAGFVGTRRSPKADMYSQYTTGNNRFGGIF